MARDPRPHSGDEQEQYEHADEQPLKTHARKSPVICEAFCGMTACGLRHTGPESVCVRWARTHTESAGHWTFVQLGFSFDLEAIGDRRARGKATA